MPSTYTLNNGIELIATGEQSGTWGDTTNTNLSLIDVSLDGQVSITLPSAGTSGSPNTLDIQDGTASNGRNRFIIFNDGGDLGSSAFVQLTPNDAEKIVYIRNNLSGSRSILVFQGTYNASNDYEIPSGTTAVVYFDGAGAGAVAANVFNNAYFDSLRLGSVSVTSILDEDNMGSDSATALATQQSIKAYVDSQVTAQDLDFAGDSGTGAVDLDSQSLTIAGTANEIETSASGQTLTVGLPDNVTITGDLTVDTDTLAVDSTNNRVGIGTTSPTGKLNVYSGDSGATTDGSADELFLEQAGNSGLTIGTPNTSTASIFFADPESSSAGRIQYLHASDSLTFGTAAAERMRIDSSGNVGIGTSSPTSSKLHIDGGDLRIQDVTPNIYFYSEGAVNNVQINANISDAAQGGIAILENGNTLIQSRTNFTQFYSANTERMRITSAGNVGIGTAAAQELLHLQKTGGSTMRFQNPGVRVWNIGNDSTSFVFYDVTAAAERMRINSSGNVGIGTASPVKRLTISGASNGNITTLTDAATITPDLDSSDMFTVTLGGNRTLANPSNIDAGQTGSIFIVQDGTGSRTLAWGSYWDFAGGTAPTLSTAAGAVDRVDFIVRTSTSIHAVFTANYS